MSQPTFVETSQHTLDELERRYKQVEAAGTGNELRPVLISFLQALGQSGHPAPSGGLRSAF